MKSLILVLLAIAMPFTDSCTDLVWTPEPIVATPTDYDFGFCGEWIGEVNDDADESGEQQVFKIERDKESLTKYTLEQLGERNSTLEFTAFRISEENEGALIQVAYPDGEDAKSYYYAFVYIENKRLLIWTIDCEKLIKTIKKDILNSVIDRHSFSTEIVAKSDELRTLMVESCNDIVSDKPLSFTRNK